MEDTELAAAMVFREAVAKGSPPDGTTKPPRCRVASMVMIPNFDVNRLLVKIDLTEMTRGVQLWRGLKMEQGIVVVASLKAAD